MPHTRPRSEGPLARTAMAFVLAGGRGSRLMELTDRRAKPAVFFGGKSRIIDFALSNAINSGVRRVAVATQYKAHSLIRHLQRGWNFLRPERNESFDILPASQRVSEHNWYLGTADAVFQNIDIIEDLAPRHIVLLAGDHIYKMDYEAMLQQHVESGAGVTVSCMTVPRADARASASCGRCHRPHRRVPGKAGRPARPARTSRSFRWPAWASMSSTPEVLVAELKRDAADPASSHDFGKDIIPRMVAEGTAQAHRFEASCVRSAAETSPYWRDVGTVDAYWEANIDLTDVVPPLDIFDKDWPIWTYAEVVPPAKFVHDLDGRRGEAISSLVSGGCIVSGASAKHSLLFTGVRLHSYAMIDGAVLLPQVDVGRRARLTNVVVDRGVHIPEGLVVGEDPVADAARFRRSEKGICLITQAMLDRIAA